MVARGIQFDGDALRRARKVRGLNQVELAEKAGVAERTVRNAERGQPVELNIAEYIAGALGVDVGELSQKELESNERTRWKQVVGELQFALAEAVANQNFEPMKALVHPHVEWRCDWTPRLPFCGEYKGISGVIDYAERCQIWLSEQALTNREAIIERIDGDGNLLFVRGKDTFVTAAGKQSFWFAHFYRIEDERIRVFSQFGGIDELR